MLKKWFFFIMALLFFGSQLSFAQEISERTVIEKIPSPLNVVLTRPSDSTRWLLKLKSGCPTLTEGQEVGLGVRGALNGNNDYLNLGPGRRCDIKEPFEFNQTLIVLSTARTHAAVADEKGRLFTLFNYEGCGDLLNWRDKEVYVNQGGQKLSKGDRLYIPGEPRFCTLKRVEEVKEEKGPLPRSKEGDITSPTDVSRVRAIPRKGRAFVYWDAATDNVGVDHYLVSTSKFLIDRKHLTKDSAPNKMKVFGTNTFVENLENDQDYYFYVLAVDAAGNTSSFWSEGARARVLSAISPDPQKFTGQGKLNLRLAHETSKSFLIKWDAPPTATRYLVALTADDELEFALKEYADTDVRILKRPDRKGKKLELEVSAFNTRGFINEEKISFSFE